MGVKNACGCSEFGSVSELQQPASKRHQKDLQWFQLAVCVPYVFFFGGGGVTTKPPPSPGVP